MLLGFSFVLNHRSCTTLRYYSARRVRRSIIGRRIWRERGFAVNRNASLLLNHEGGKLPVFFAAKAVDMKGVGNLTLPNESLHVRLPVTLDAQNSKVQCEYRQWPSFMRI